MSNLNISKAVNTVKTALADHTPEILTGIGIGGMLTTVILSVRATPTALALIEAEKDRQNEALFEEAVERGVETYGRVTELKPVEVIKTCWKCYIPAVVVGSVSTACLIGANSVHTKRHTALAAAYSISETALKEYQEKVVETIGEKKEQAVRDAIAKDKIEKDPVTGHEIVFTGNGDTLFYDVTSARYFKSDIDTVKRAVNDLNRRMRDEMYISLNEYYFEIGVDHTSIGDDLGWNIDTGYIEPQFSAQLAPDETPCVVISHAVPPKYGYTRLR